MNPHAQELAQEIDTHRLEIRLEEINQFRDEELNEIIYVFKKNSTLIENIQVDKMHQAIEVASAISEVDSRVSTNIKNMEEYAYFVIVMLQNEYSGNLFF